jgi:hypothetical protein
MEKSRANQRVTCELPSIPSVDLRFHSGLSLFSIVELFSESFSDQLDLVSRIQHKPCVLSRSIICMSDSIKPRGITRS